MTPKELGELGHLEVATPMVDMADFPPVEADEALDPGHRKSITILREFAAAGPDGAKPKRIVFDFFAKPLRIEGDGRAERLVVERTELDESGAAKGTGETYEVAASLIVTSIGYQTPRIDGVPYDERGGKFANDQGKIGDGLYAVGWARRGPTGTIGTNRPDGYEVAEQIAAVMAPGSDGGKAGGSGLVALLGERGVTATSFDNWRSIEAAEVAAARPGSPREKFVRHEDWLKVLGR
jgi:ferredoxin--NADP+ reductase